MTLRPHPLDTELTTAATDLLLGLLCLAVIWWLSDLRSGFVRTIWMSVFALMAIASLLGAAAHGFDLSSRVRTALWQPLYLSLGLIIALLIVAGIHDWRGETAARTLLPWAVAAGAGFYAVTYALGGAFAIFIVFEAVAMIFVCGLYLLLWSRGAPGSALITAGVGLSIAAAAVQATTMSVRVVVPFDHNGLFHLVQLVATSVLAAGVRASLDAAP